MDGIKGVAVPGEKEEGETTCPCETRRRDHKNPDNFHQGTMTRCWRLWVMLLATVLVPGAAGSHFRGASISWKPLPATNTVSFSFWMAWRFGSGRGCSENTTGQFLNNGVSPWTCSSGCVPSQNVGDDAYTCRAASVVDDYEQGEHSFNYTFPSQGPFWITHQSCCWVTLGQSGNGNWNVSTMVDLRPRSDTNSPNSSPCSVGNPLYCVGYGTRTVLRLPVADADGDKVRCRWATGNECGSVCNSLPGASLDGENCLLTVETTTANGYVSNTDYAVALTLEDFPPSTITMGGHPVTTSEPMSAVPLQFLVRTASCTSSYDFISPTPDEGSTMEIEEGETLGLLVYAYAHTPSTFSESAVSITTTGIPAASTSPVTSDDQCRSSVVYSRVTWVPSRRDVGEHSLCAHILDHNGQVQLTRCFNIVVKRGPCGCTTTQVWTGDAACLIRDAIAAATGFAVALFLVLLLVLAYALTRRVCSRKNSASRSATVAPLPTETRAPDVLPEAPVSMATEAVAIPTGDPTPMAKEAPAIVNEAPIPIATEASANIPPANTTFVIEANS